MGKLKRSPYDRILNFAVLVLVTIGYIMVVSAHSAVYIKFGTFKFVEEIAKITVYIIIGFFIMIWFRKKFSIKLFFKYINVITIVLALMMIATLFFPEVNGSKRWIRIGPMTIQPIEFFKMYFIVMLSYHFYYWRNKKVKVYRVLLAPVLAMLAITVFVFILQGDLGSTLILMMIGLSIFFAVPGKRYNKVKKWTAILIVLFLVLFYAFGPRLSDYIYNMPETSSLRIRLLRIAVLFDPLKDVLEYGFQLTQSLAAITSSGLIGAGLGNSEVKHILPEPYNDAIIAVIAEETGLIGIFIIFALFFIIVRRIFIYAMKARDNIIDSLVLVGIASFFIIQFFVNVGGMVGLIPMTGVTLPFISSGGSATASSFMAIGIAQSIIKRYNYVKPKS